MHWKSLLGIVLLAAMPMVPQEPASSRTWRMTWNDEFNGPDGSAPDAAKWVYDVGGDGWLNHELETYTKRRENVRVEGGNLVIEARREDLAGPDGTTPPGG